MSADELRSTLTQGLSELKKKFATASPPQKFSEEWYAGLSAQPVRFSEQLLSLQDALNSFPSRGREGAYPIPAAPSPPSVD